MMHTSGFGYGMIGWSWFFQLLIFIILLLVIWWLVSNMHSFGFHTHSRESAEDLLKKRLVKGEISAEDYRKLKREIA